MRPPRAGLCGARRLTHCARHEAHLAKATTRRRDKPPPLPLSRRVWASLRPPTRCFLFRATRGESMIRYVALALCLFIPTAWGDLYKWTDENGKVHYSDQPPPGDVK